MDPHTFTAGDGADAEAYRASLVVENNKLVDLLTMHAGSVVSDQGLAAFCELVAVACNVPDFNSLTVRHISRLDPLPVTHAHAVAFLRRLHMLNHRPAAVAAAPVEIAAGVAIATDDDSAGGTVNAAEVPAVPVLFHPDFVRGFCEDSDSARTVMAHLIIDIVESCAKAHAISQQVPPPSVRSL